MIRQFVILTALFARVLSGNFSSESDMKNAVFAWEALKQRVCRRGDAEISELETLPLEPFFSFDRFPQVHTASLRGRRGIQSVTESETSEGSRRNA
jgi:hypothetical protein